MEDYLIQQGIDGAMLRQGNGEEITGQDLTRVVDLARQMRRVLEAFPTHYPRHILGTGRHCRCLCARRG